MRLIDADALIETMKKLETEYEEAMTCPSWWTTYSVISEQPTAYDVEKVVAELQKYSAYRYSEAGECWERHIYLDTAKKIVKRGGINE